MNALCAEESVCRVCGRKEEFRKLRNIFDGGSGGSLEFKISKLLHVVVLPWDPFSHDICKTCMDKLDFFNEFYNDAERTDRFLRKFFPSAPQRQIEAHNAMVTISDCFRSLKRCLKLPENNNEERPKSPIPIIEIEDDDEEEANVPVDEVKEADVKPPSPKQPPKTPDDFMVNKLSSTDSIFTCRACYRSFTKESSALSHECMTIEKCREFELAEINEEEPPKEKALPPLKIRLFTNQCGKFICYICQTSFDDRMKVVEHLKNNCLNGGEKLENKTRKRKKSGSRKNSLESDIKKSCEIQNSADRNVSGQVEYLKQINLGFTPRKTGVTSTVTSTVTSPVTTKVTSSVTTKVTSTVTSPVFSPVTTKVTSTVTSPVFSPINTKVTSTVTSPVFSSVTSKVTSTVTSPVFSPVPPPVFSPVLSPIFSSVFSPVTTKVTSTVTSAATSTQTLDAYTLDTNSFTENWNTRKETNEKASNTVDEYALDVSEVEELKVKDRSKRKKKEKKNRLFSCVFCDKIYARRDFLRQHQKKHLGSVKDTIRFLYSEESDTEEKEDERHVGKSGSKEGMYVCEVCSMVFTKKKTLMLHENYHYVNQD